MWVIDGLILASWFLMVGLAVVHEQGLWGGLPRIARTIPAPLEIREQWCGVYYQGRKIGFTSVTLVPHEQDGVPGVAITDRGQLRFSLLGAPQRIDLHAWAFIDADRQLNAFTAVVQTEGSQLKIEGKRQGDAVAVTLSSPTSSWTQRIPDPSGKLWLSGLSSWATFHQLEVGQWGYLVILNPLALKPEQVHFAVRRRETFAGAEALVIETDYLGLSTTTWMTPEGAVLKETSPMGWELIREPKEQAMAMEAQASEALDLLSTVSVRADLSGLAAQAPHDAASMLADPASLTRLTVLVDGFSADDVPVDRRPWQEFLSADLLSRFGQERPPGRWCLIRLERLPRALDYPTHPAPPTRYVSPSPFVQSNHPRIRDRAERITASLTDPLAQAEALCDWVYRTLTKRLTIGLPSATDVLANPVGDCHEHTVLFTALARSLGIPTRMMAGLVAYEGRFYYHAWPEVWVAGTTGGSLGVWIPLDPTLGEHRANPTHLGLAEAENETLVSLAQFVGRLHLRVLEIQ